MRVIRLRNIATCSSSLFFNLFSACKKAHLAIYALFFVNAGMLMSQCPNVPYFYQYNNSINPGGSCQNTSIAMLLKYYGATAITPDNISNSWGTSQAQTVSGFNTVCNSEAQDYGLSETCISTTSGSFAALNSLLAQGIPVAVHGYFTSYGHVMVVLAYTGSEYICNDPAGEWSQQYGNGGYSTVNATEGIQVHYSSSAFLNAIGPDNTLWYHYIDGGLPNTDIIAPTAQITVPSGWQTQNFTTTFTDTDNIGGSGIKKRFYQVLENTGAEWRANNLRGFFSDNFDNVIHSDWTAPSGAWTINAGVLEQNNQTNINTNIYAPLTQNLSNSYLYNWKGKIGGTGTNRRAGFHFFCDNASQTNRGNSYFVWFRADLNELNIYKVVNNTFGAAVLSCPVTINVNTWYDYKVIYDRISGKIDIYVNDDLITSWTDPAPYLNGNYISFRSANCNYQVNNLKVYRSRLSSVTVKVGAALINDLRFQNPNLSEPSGLVKSISQDAAGNLSAVASKVVNVDWTIPSSVIVNDGTSIDIDTSNSLTKLSANWTASTDNNSGIVKYWYAIGTTAGATNVTNWTDNGLSRTITKTGLSLSANQLYYFSVVAKNGAGLQTPVHTSNGQVAVVTSFGINGQFNEHLSSHNEELPNSIASEINGQPDAPLSADEIVANFGLAVYPNPFTTATTISYYVKQAGKIDISVCDVFGKQINLLREERPIGNYKLTINASDFNFTSGVYVVKLKTTGGEKSVKIVVQ